MKNKTTNDETINPKKIKRVKLNYAAATKHTPPVSTVPISSCHMELLDKAIKEKVKQNKEPPHNIYY